MAIMASISRPTSTPRSTFASFTARLTVAGRRVAENKMFDGRTRMGLTRSSENKGLTWFLLGPPGGGGGKKPRRGWGIFFARCGITAQADVRCWMGFGDHYINVFTAQCCQNLLIVRTAGSPRRAWVVPLKVVKSVAARTVRTPRAELYGKDLYRRLAQRHQGRKDVEVFVLPTSPSQRRVFKLRFGQSGHSILPASRPWAMADAELAGWQKNLLHQTRWLTVEKLGPPKTADFMPCYDTIGLAQRVL